MRYLLLLLITLVCLAPAGLYAQADTTTMRTEGTDITIEADRVYSAASDRSFLAKRFELAPRNSTQDLLRIVPGLVIAQHAGGGKAEQIFLRGFDADHGTDVNIAVDDAPINMVSHGHGQGYADLHFIIPETIEAIDVVKGPYFARYGDLTTAGSISFRTKNSLDKSLVKLEGGAFNTYRALTLLSNPVTITGVNSYVAAEIYGTKGYFDAPQDMQRVNLFAKATSEMESSLLSASIMSFASGWDASGQIPERAVNSGAIGRFGSINDLEGGSTSRTTGILKYETRGQDPFTVSASVTSYDFRLFSDFTFFARDSARGDMIEQTDNRTIIGLKAEKQLMWPIADNLFSHTRLGMNFRSDDIAVGLYEDSLRARHTAIVDASIVQRQIGPYIEQEFITPFAHLQLGLRVDYVNYNVVNNLDLGDQPSGIAQQFVVSPKANLSIPFHKSTTLFLNSGFGFHSNDARAVVQEKGRPLPRAFGSELGLRYVTKDALLSTSAALWVLDLEEELVYVGDEGTTEISGRTRRAGIDLEMDIRPLDWLTLSSSLTLSQGRYRDLPEGENRIPLAPDRTLTGSVTTRFDELAAALHVRHVGDRPANETGSVIALGYTVLDLTAQYTIGNYMIFGGIDNLLDVKWNEAQFDTESRLRQESEPVSELHFTPGTPRSLKLGIGYMF